MSASPHSPPQPLSGIRVLDLTRLLPGPWSTMLLADLGAEVIKIENREGGDGSRHATPRYGTGEASESVYFCNVNRNKRSVALDLKAPDDLAAFRRLVVDADVVVENFRAGGAERLGIGYAQLRELNPRLIYCALTGYGQDGPLASLAGHDLNIAGMSGLLQLDAADAPAMPNMLMGDYAGAAMAVIGLLSALVDRERHGRGAFVDVSMLDALMSWTGVQMTRPFARAAGSACDGAVEGWGANPRYGIYRTRDGRYLTVSLLEKKYWDAFCRRYGRPDLVNPHETEADRLTSHGERGEAFRSFLEALFATRDRDDWVAELQAQAIPVCPVLTPEEAFRSPYGKLRNHYLDLDMPRVGTAIPQLGFPFRMTTSDGAAAFRLRHAPPALGEANDEYGTGKARGGTHGDVR
jgi:crotonobetainyl-CoA:carnitine CoA-transferase CaiB-like acyl-CoA transferase